MIEMIDDEDNLFLFLQYGRSLATGMPTGRPVFDSERVKQRQNTDWKASAKIERKTKTYARDPSQMYTKPSGAGVFPSPTPLPFVFEYVAREYLGYGVAQYD